MTSARAFATLGTPGVLKTRRLGYDGKGQRVLRVPADVDTAWAALGGVPLILEGFVPFSREVSCLGVRAKDGAIRFYPLVENVHASGILRLSRPRASDPLQAAAERLTGQVMVALDYVGVMAFEFFVTPAGLIANEIAPRVHNSGHWTIEGAVCSQFENHLRAVLGLPLGEPGLTGPVAMLNLIGLVPDRDAVLAVPGAHLHWYGKNPKPGRKVGHITVTAPDDASLDARLGAVAATGRKPRAQPRPGSRTRRCALESAGSRQELRRNATDRQGLALPGHRAGQRAVADQFEGLAVGGRIGILQRVVQVYQPLRIVHRVGEAVDVVVTAVRRNDAVGFIHGGPATQGQEGFGNRTAVPACGVQHLGEPRADRVVLVSRYGDGRKNADDRDDDHQFDQGEAPLAMAAC